MEKAHIQYWEKECVNAVIAGALVNAGYEVIWVNPDYSFIYEKKMEGQIYYEAKVREHRHLVGYEPPAGGGISLNPVKFPEPLMPGVPTAVVRVDFFITIRHTDPQTRDPLTDHLLELSQIYRLDYVTLDTLPNSISVAEKAIFNMLLQKAKDWPGGIEGFYEKYGPPSGERVKGPRIP